MNEDHIETEWHNTQRKDICIGLFGTCGNSTWRKHFIDAYEAHGITYFNPQVEKWTPECAKLEAAHLSSDDIILFPVTDETYGFGSLAEIGFAVARAAADPLKYVIVYVAEKCNVPEPSFHALQGSTLQSMHMLWTNQVKESDKARALTLAHLSQAVGSYPRVLQVNNLDEMLQKSIRIFDQLQYSSFKTFTFPTGDA